MIRIRMTFQSTLKKFPFKFICKWTMTLLNIECEEYLHCHGGVAGAFISFSKQLCITINARTLTGSTLSVLFTRPLSSSSVPFLCLVASVLTNVITAVAVPPILGKSARHEHTQSGLSVFTVS